MSVGIDIKDAIAEVGGKITIIRDSGNITNEYILTKANTQVTKPFIREFFLEAQLAYDSVAVVGDVIQLDTIAQKFLLMNLTGDTFENERIRNAGVLYKCNVSGELFRPSGEVFNSQTYRKVTVWDSIGTNIYSLQTEPLFGNTLDTDEELGLIGLERDELYIPSSVGIQVNDRYQPVSGEYHRVESVITRRYDGVDVVELGEDNR